MSNEAYAIYRHLKMHPSYYKAAKSLAAKVVAKDQAATSELHGLIESAKTDPAAANALKLVCCVLKYEYPDFVEDKIFSGGDVGKVVKVVTTPVSWLLNAGGKLLNFTGHTLRKVSHHV